MAMILFLYSGLGDTNRFLDLKNAVGLNDLQDLQDMQDN
jgi:hypothetical protein